MSNEGDKMPSEAASRSSDGLGGFLRFMFFREDRSSYAPAAFAWAYVIIGIIIGPLLVILSYYR